jgi:16S rRNA (cytosine1402-N4)-methyltransferase
MTTPTSSPSSGSDPAHEPVLASEVVRLLNPRPDGVYIDCTVGLGGHARALLMAGGGRVIGIDRDASALEGARARLADVADRIELVHGEYGRIVDLVAARRVTKVDGVLADLGVSSMQLDQPERGFSFRRAGPLDMRMDRTCGETLAERLADIDERALADVIWRFGEERHSRRVARAIVAARDAGRLNDTADLAVIVRRAVGGRGWQRLDPATRTFQALRIWVNDEIDGLRSFVEAAWSVLAKGGRLAVIAFHSLEDRVVKQTFRSLVTDAGAARLLTVKPIVASDEERERNPRARSAKLRGLERVA